MKVQEYAIGKILKNTSKFYLICRTAVLLGGDKYVACSYVLPLLSYLTKHMTVNDDGPGYLA